MVNKQVPDYIRAHDFCTFNREQFSQDEPCGCFYCLDIFTVRDIKEWIPEEHPESVTYMDKKNLVTAVCPHCGIDSVIGASSGFPITKEFLQKMHDYWF